MRDRAKHQKRKILLTVTSVLLAAWIMVSVMFFFVVVSLEKNSQFNDAKYNEEVFVSKLDDAWIYDFCLGIDMYRRNTSALAYGLRDKDTNEYLTDIQISAVPDCELEFVFNTDNAVCVNFFGINNEYDDQFVGLLSYDRFISSMTDEQYKSISGYLNKDADEDGKRYYLICTEFYTDPLRVELVPKTLELVYRENEVDWHIEKQVVETYSLNPEGVEGLMVFKMDSDRSNNISRDFFFGNFKSIGFIENADKKLSFGNDEEKSEVVNSPKFETIAPFDYVYRNVTQVTVITDETMEQVNGQNMSRNEVHTFYVKYAKRLNVFEECSDFLALGFALVFLFFAISGVIVSVMLVKIMNTQLKEEQKRREVTSALAHDIKTPLFIIEGYAQSLKENINTDKQSHYAERIIERTKEVNTLVHKMLDFSKLDSPDYVVRKELVDVFELLSYVFEDYSDLKDNKTLKLNIKSKPTISADPGLMTRAFTNLMENAVSYSDVHTVIGVELTDKYLSISNVCSNLSEEDIKHLTEPYYRGDKNRGSKGNGLGLAFVKSVADLHGFGLNISLDEKVITIKINFNKER